MSNMDMIIQQVLSLKCFVPGTLYLPLTRHRQNKTTIPFISEPFFNTTVFNQISQLLLTLFDNKASIISIFLLQIQTQLCNKTRDKRHQIFEVIFCTLVNLITAFKILSKWWLHRWCHNLLFCQHKFYFIYKISSSNKQQDSWQSLFLFVIYHLIFN